MFRSGYISQYVGLDCIIGNFVHLTRSCSVWNILLGFIDSANYYLVSIYVKDFGDNVDLKSLSIKIVYKNLLKKVFMPPLIVSKFPVKDFSPVWAAVNDNFLDPEITTFAYMMSRDAD